ncbi:M20/M25/M40 family metallo-hydrolase [uncultured Clostridium sp.]|uniref:M20/M25/M40 family metallo-hydrolase n=1 Tax=uncultured Clostridium sp. TaxID=59620 RepID=UPI002629D529|nr:M20/M25/M40 family metallo-hydrolase [uncultured Clostridium sp.]
MSRECKEYALLLGELIKCRTVYDKEDDSEFIRFRERLKMMFTLIYKNAKFEIFGDGALLYKFEGEDNKRSILLMSHHDAVAENGEWCYEPFGGEIKDGKLLGRGTVDTKTSFFAELMALEELLEEGFIPKVNVYIASSNNEEVGGEGIILIKDYLEKENINLELVIDEGGAIIDPPLPGLSQKCAMIAVHEKGRTILECTARDNAGHASFKSEESTVVRVARFINEVSNNNIFERKLYKEVRAMFKELSSYMSFKEKLIFSNIDIFFPIIKRVLPKISKEGAEMLGTSCSFTSINGGFLDERRAKETTVIAFLRAITEEDLKRDIDKIKTVADKSGIEVKIRSSEMPKEADLNHKNYAYVKDTIRSVFGDIPIGPYILPAGTDARHLTSLCSCTLRFAPIILSKEQFKYVHNINENIEVEVIGQAVQFYKNLIIKYK